MNQIEWRDVVGYEGSYQVSNTGIVKSVGRKVRFGKNSFRITEDKIIYQHDFRGYRQVGLWRGLTGKSFKVHKLVLEAFVGPKPSGFVCCHWNGIPSDNRVENLRWDTPKENTNDRVRTGSMLYGESNPKAKLTRADVSTIKDSQLPVKELALIYGVTTKSIYNIRNGATWAK